MERIERFTAEQHDKLALCCLIVRRKRILPLTSWGHLVQLYPSTQIVELAFLHYVRHWKQTTWLAVEEMNRVFVGREFITLGDFAAFLVFLKRILCFEFRRDITAALNYRS